MSDSVMQILLVSLAPRAHHVRAGAHECIGLLLLAVRFLDGRDDGTENLAEDADILVVARHDVAQAVVVHCCGLLVADVEECDGGAEEGVVASEDVEGGDVDDSAVDLVGELGGDAVLALHLERWGARDEDGKLDAAGGAAALEAQALLDD